MANTIQEFSKEFSKENKIGPNGIHWIITWDLAMIEGKKLWKLLELALPHSVMLHEKYYKNYEKVYEWLEENSSGLWSHSQLLFVFEKEEDAMAFKLRWL